VQWSSCGYVGWLWSRTRVGGIVVLSLYYCVGTIVFVLVLWVLGGWSTVSSKNESTLNLT
jgi:hypothetical protein